MSRPYLVFRKIVAKAIPIYRCGKCGVMEKGSTVTIDIELDGPAVDATDKLNDHNVSNTHMPVGWSGHGVDYHLCPRCKG